jgi:hypothetical protein
MVGRKKPAGVDVEPEHEIVEAAEDSDQTRKRKVGGPGAAKKKKAKKAEEAGEVGAGEAEDVEAEGEGEAEAAEGAKGKGKGKGRAKAKEKPIVTEKSHMPRADVPADGTFKVITWSVQQQPLTHSQPWLNASSYHMHQERQRLRGRCPIVAQGAAGPGEAGEARHIVPARDEAAGAKRKAV